MVQQLFPNLFDSQNLPFFLITRNRTTVSIYLFLLCFSCFFSCGVVKYDIVTEKVFKPNEDTSTNTSCKYFRAHENFNKMCFVCNNKCINNNSAINKAGIGRPKMDYAKDHLTE